MSMCFIYKGILYADCFQIRNYITYDPTIIDNKIYTNKSKKIVVVPMGHVPENIHEVIDKIEEYVNNFNQKLFESSIRAMDVDLLAVVKIRKDQYYAFKYISSKDKKMDFSYVCKKLQDLELSMGTPGYIYSLLNTGMTPAQIFKGNAIARFVTSEKYTAYDLGKSKFVKV